MEIYRDTDQPAMSPAPAPRTPRRGAAILAGATVTAALVIGGGAYAMADPTTPASPTATPTTGAQGKQTMGGTSGRHDRGRPLHGDMVTDQNGAYVTVRMQEGTVTAKTDASLTLKSKDGYEQTYALDAGTRYGGAPGMMGRGHGHGRHGMQSGPRARAAQQPAAPATRTLADVNVGDTVRVMATVKDGTATAARVHDEAWRPAGMPQGGPDGDHDRDGTTAPQDGQPAPTASSTTGTQG